MQQNMIQLPKKKFTLIIHNNYNDIKEILSVCLEFKKTVQCIDFLFLWYVDRGRRQDESGMHIS